MQLFKVHIVNLFLGCLLSLAVLAPIMTKFAHTFSHVEHHHEVCHGESSAHLHSIDFDCEFYKFKLNNQVTFQFVDLEPLVEQLELKNKDSYYSSVSSYQKLHFLRRGPPFSIGGIN